MEFFGNLLRRDGIFDGIRNRPRGQRGEPRRIRGLRQYRAFRSEFDSHFPVAFGLRTLRLTGQRDVEYGVLRIRSFARGKSRNHRNVFRRRKRLAIGRDFGIQRRNRCLDGAERRHFEFQNTAERH